MRERGFGLPYSDRGGGFAKALSYERRHSLMYAFLYTTLMASLIAQHFIKAVAKPSAFGFKIWLCISAVMILFYGLLRGVASRNDERERLLAMTKRKAHRNDGGKGCAMVRGSLDVLQSKTRDDRVKKCVAKRGMTVGGVIANECEAI